MLTTADIIFIIDESFSGSTNAATEWIGELVAGKDLNDDGDATDEGVDILDLSTRLAGNGITNMHYGLIGIGEQSESTFRFAHSHIVDSVNPLLAPSSSIDYAEWLEIFNGLSQEGGDEDGWDALEHAIAEYPLRPGAIPIFILVQNDEGRVGPTSDNGGNETLTHEGVLAALRSKNAVLNVMVTGRAAVLDQFGVPSEWDPVFNLQQYGSPNTHIVLGVDADGADGIFDGQHTYYGFDTEEDEIPTPEPTISNALQISYHGSNTGPSGMVQTGKSVLISRDPEMTDGIGSLPGEDANPYRAKNILFAPVDMTGATSHSETPFTISFDFLFFDDEYDSVYVQQDGLLSFLTVDAPLLGFYEGIDLSRADSSEVSMPIIAPLWQDLAVPSGGTLLEKTADLDGDSLDDLVIEWRNYSYPHDLYGAYDTISFQAVLYGSGNIEFHYLDLDSYPHNANDELADDTGGIHTTVGIWSGDVDPVYIAAGKYVPGLHSPGGEIETHTHGELRDSYIRMAWDTGGSAWDIGIVPTYELGSPEANQLRDDFVASLASQIIAADAAKLGTLLETDASGRILLALNVGSTSQVDAGDAGIFRADNGTYTANVGASGVDSFTDAFPTVDVESTNSIPAGTTASLRQIFSSARGEQGLDSDGLESISLTIDKLDLAGTPDLKDGPYVVELFFAELGTAGSNEVADNRVFDVLIEGQTVLNDYNIAKDHAKIDTSYSPNIEYDSQQLGIFTGVVKRFFVQVSGNNGLQIELIPEEGTYTGRLRHDRQSGITRQSRFP